MFPELKHVLWKLGILDATQLRHEGCNLPNDFAGEDFLLRGPLLSSLLRLLRRQLCRLGLL